MSDDPVESSNAPELAPLISKYVEIEINERDCIAAYKALWERATGSAVANVVVNGLFLIFCMIYWFHPPFLYSVDWYWVVLGAGYCIYSLSTGIRSIRSRRRLAAQIWALHESVPLQLEIWRSDTGLAAVGTDYRFDASWTQIKRVWTSGTLWLAQVDATTVIWIPKNRFPTIAALKAFSREIEQHVKVAKSVGSAFEVIPEKAI